MSDFKCLEEIEFDPPKGYVRTRSNLPADAVWAALKNFTRERVELWPFIEPSLYEIYETADTTAEVKEGTKMMPGMSVWARERYEWDDANHTMTATVVESNIFEVGGTGRFTVTSTDDGGSILEETYNRNRIGWKATLINRMFPKMAPKMFDDGRAKTYDILRERTGTPAETGAKAASDASPT